MASYYLATFLALRLHLVDIAWNLPRPLNIPLKVEATLPHAEHRHTMVHHRTTLYIIAIMGMNIL